MNGMPYMDINVYPNNNINIFQTIERLTNKINRLEKQVRILENRVNNLSNNTSQFIKNEYDDNDNMYIL